MIRFFVHSLWFRLIVGFGVPLVLFLGAALVSYLTVQRLIDALAREQASQQVLSNINDLTESLEAMAAAKRGHHLTGRREFKIRFDASRQEFLDDLRSLKEHAGNDARWKHLVEIEHLEKQFRDNAEPSFALWKKRPKDGNPVEKFLKEILEKTNLDRGVQLIKQIRTAADSLKTLEVEQFNQDREEVLARTGESNWAIVVAFIVSIGFSIAIALLLSWSITKPIDQLGKAIHSLRQGKFEVLRSYGPTEIATLIRGFNLMGIALTEKTMLLESSELRYRTVVGTTSNLLWTTNANGENTEMANWAAFTGQKEEELVGDGWLQAVHPEDRERFLTHWQQALTNKAHTEGEFRFRRSDGTYRDFTCRSVPIFDSNEEIVEWVRICVDITDRKQEEKLRREKKAAETANRAKSEFLAKMSHELRTPLNAIIGMSKMLNTGRFGKLNDKQLDYLSDITQAGEHLLELINDILDLSKVEAGRIELKPEPIAGGKTVDQVVSTVRTLAASKKLKLNTRTPEPDGILTADLGRFKQILFNLISNAVKFTAEEGKISIRCHWVRDASREAPVATLGEAEALRIDVEDTGVGIAPEDQEKLGTEFFQANSSPTKAEEGTGLGLALTQRLVDIMGGSFWFTSELGQGSTFSFALPLRPQQKSGSASILSTEESAEKPSGPLRRTGRPLSLVIDDHVPTNKLLADWLDEAGLDSASAYDGENGLKEARRLQPQLILLDIRLPRMSGLEVLNHLKSDPATASIPVVVVTVLEGINHFQEIDVVDWFVKPLDKEHVLQRLRKNVPSLFSINKKVLIVDDDEKDRKWLCELLEAEDLGAREAANGKQALQQMETELPNLVLIDLFMPERDGFQLVQRIRGRSEWQKLPIIIVTAKDLTAEERRCLEGNIQAILRKDALTQQQLLDRLRSLL